MKDLKNEILKLIVEVEGVENILNKHIRPFFDKYGVTKTQNAIDYFTYSKQGQNIVLKALNK